MYIDTEKTLREMLGTWHTKDECVYQVHRLINKVTYPFRRVFRWLVKTAQYSKILWEDYDWDDVYIWKLLKYKLERTRKCLINDPWIGTDERRDRVERKIRTCELLLDRIIKDEYFYSHYQKWEEKWGRNTDIDDFLEDINKPMEPKEKREFFAMQEHEKMQRDQDFDLLFKILKRNSKEWWS